MSRRRLPPLGAVRAFEAVARLASFKAAAAELFVTPTAVSHQVRELERRLGTQLLARSPRPVKLTPEGEVLSEAAGAAFDGLDAATSRIRALGERRILTLSATTAFLSHWLVPRLHRLKALVPDVELRLDASDTVVPLRSGAIDMAVRYGEGPWTDLEQIRLARDSFAPVCSPVLGIDGPADLQNATLIHIDGRSTPQPPPDWSRWAAAAKVAGLQVDEGPRFTDELHAVQTAIAGQGVVIASLVLVSDALRSGLLVRPFTAALSGAAYHAVWALKPEGDTAPARIAAWLAAEMAQVGPDDDTRTSKALHDPARQQEGQ